MEAQKVLSLHKELLKKKPQLQGEYMLSVKEDGWYLTIDYWNGEWQPIRSSAGREIPSTSILHKLIFDKLPRPNKNVRLIMEGTIKGHDFYSMNGLFNRSVGDFLLDPQSVLFYVHDCIPLDTYFITKTLENQAIERWKTLSQLDISNVKDSIILHAPIDVCGYGELWYRHFNEVIEQGKEGIVCKRTTSLYTPGKRNSDLVKIKLEETFDLHCVDMQLSYGEKGNSSTNLLLVDKRGTQVIVRIGKDKDIASFSLSSPVGKVVEIACMGKTPAGSYRQPVFKTIRNDKVYGDID